MRKVSGRQSFAIGATVLIASNFIVKILGALFQIIMLNIIGSDVMGLYAAAFKVYAFFFIITTTGLPIAVSRMIASSTALGRAREVKRSFKISMSLFIVLGLIGSLIMFVFAKQISELLKMEEAVYAIRVIAPSILLICVVSGFRGYYQGLQNMTPTAISQIIEVLFKLLVGFGAGYWAFRQEYSYGIVAAYVISGITVGVVFSAAYMLLEYYKNKKIPIKNTDRTSDSYQNILKRIFMIGLPITLTAVIINSVGIIDVFSINRILSNSMIEDSAESFYSWYVNIAETLSSMPSSIIVAIGISILPAITYAIVQKQIKKVRWSIRAAVRITAILAIPSGIGMSILARPIIMLLFINSSETAAINETLSVAAIDVAAPCLVILSIAMIATCLYTTTTSVMQSCGLQGKTVWSGAKAIAVKFVVSIGLLYIPGVGIYGAAIGTVLCYYTALISNVGYLNKYFGRPLGILKILMRPLYASLICGAAAWSMYKLLYFIYPSNAIAVLGSIIVAIVVYTAALLLIKAIPPVEIKMLPKGEKIYALLRRYNLINEVKVKNER
ncbi:MAG: hypothetical protein A2Y17_00280 [Clostridiales bacterium GWF2_38_85]|nr:MAG: hypothetical protein A2Y17_00280 [Clostridiales bacterium GWF2_38_85]HBL83897.1 hypothetical protein [Clostridiales bacterium]